MSSHWKVIIDELKGIENVLIQKQKYILKADALILANIDVNGYNKPKQDLLTPSLDSSDLNPSPTLKGLLLLVDDIAFLLNRAFILQQKYIINIKNESSSCYNFITKNENEFHGKFNPETELNMAESNLLDIDDFLPSIVNDWNQLPSALDDNYSDVNYHSLSSSGSITSSPQSLYMDRKRKLDFLMKKLSRKLENCYNDLQVLIDVKIQSHNAIKKIMDIYLHFLIQEAQNNGISNALYRAMKATKTPFSNLLAIRFLEISECDDLLNTIKTSWRTLYSQDSQYIADRSLAMQYSANDQLSDEWFSHAKLGAGCLLTFWAFSECFNNEKLGRYIWNVSLLSFYL